MNPHRVCEWFICISYLVAHVHIFSQCSCMVVVMTVGWQGPPCQWRRASSSRTNTDIWILYMFSYCIAVLIIVVIVTTDTRMGNIIIIIWACACITTRIKILRDCIVDMNAYTCHTMSCTAKKNLIPACPYIAFATASPGKNHQLCWNYSAGVIIIIMRFRVYFKIKSHPPTLNFLIAIPDNRPLPIIS